MKNSKLLSLLLIATLVFTSCDNDDPEPVNEEEVITTLTATLTPVWWDEYCPKNSIPRW